MRSHSCGSPVCYVLYVVAENGQVNDVKNMVVSPGTGIDLEFDSDGKYFCGSRWYFVCFISMLF